VHTPVREIAARAGVDVGTVYRHFPQRSDLVAAVFRHELDACADAAPALAAEYEPGEALERWLQRYTSLLATKRGLAAALHSETPAFEAGDMAAPRERTPPLSESSACAQDSHGARIDSRKHGTHSGERQRRCSHQIQAAPLPDEDPDGSLRGARDPRRRADAVARSVG
jgi:AcrR family transcriptional regulator